MGRIPLWLALTAFGCVSAWGGSQVLSWSAGGNEYRYRFDPKRMSEEKLRAALAFGPHAEPPGLGFMLETCDADDRRYQSCDAGPGTPEFLKNAGVSLDRATKDYERFKALRVPKGLAAVKEHLKRAGAFYIWLQKTRLDFHVMPQLHVLKRKFADLDPDEKCPGALEKISGAPSRAEMLRFARVDWHNCMNLAFLKRYGEYPAGIWEAFLKANGIKDVTDEPISRAAASATDELPVRTRRR